MFDIHHKVQPRRASKRARERVSEAILEDIIKLSQIVHNSTHTEQNFPHAGNY